MKKKKNREEDKLNKIRGGAAAAYEGQCRKCGHAHSNSMDHCGATIGWDEATQKNTHCMCRG